MLWYKDNSLRTGRALIAGLGALLPVVAALIALGPEAVRADRFNRVPSSDDPTRAQVAAATANGVDRLVAEVSRAALREDLTVEHFVAATGSADAFREALDRGADQIGGPRWIDEQTCQVRLEITGDRVAQALLDIARRTQERSPIGPDELERRVADWSKRRFAATGTSMASDRAAAVRPPGEAWRSVSDEERVRAVHAARDAAVLRVLGTIAPIAIPADGTVGEVLTRHEQARQLVSDWLRARPVYPVDFSDDLQVTLTLAARGEDVFTAFTSAARNSSIEMPADDAGMAGLRTEFIRAVTPAAATGRSHVSVLGRPNGGNAAGAGPSAPGAAVEVIRAPAQPPEWVFRQIDAEGRAPFRASALLTRQDAEDQAFEAVRAKLLAQPIAPGRTIGEAARGDVVVRNALDRALQRARVYKVDYNSADGSVMVKMMLDPREFWRELSQP